MGFPVVFVFVITVRIVKANDISEPPLDETYEWADFRKPSEVRARQLQLLSRVLNRATDPCGDFYEFTCGNYARNKSILHRSGPINEKLMQEILLTGSYIPENEAERKAMQYFNVCVSDWPRNQSLVSVMADIDGILKGHATERAFNWLEVEGFLTTINLPLLLDFSVNEGQLQVEAVGIWHCFDFNENWTVSKYVEYTQSNLSFLNVQGSSLDEICRSLESFRTSLRNFMIDFVNDNQALNMSNVYTRIENLGEVLPLIDMKKYLSIVLGAEFNSSSEIKIVAPASFSVVAQFMSQVDPTQTLNFYRWHIADRLGQQIQGYSAHEGHIAKVCYQNTYLNFKSALLSIFKNVYFHPESEPEVKDMFERIKEEFQELVQEAFRSDNHTKDEAMRKIDSITLELLFPSYILEEKSLIEEYRNFQVDPSNFVRNSLSGSTLQLLRAIRLNNQQQSQVDINWRDEYPLRADPFFDEKHKGIMHLSVGTLKPPFFHPYFYRFYNYGILGFIMGHEITHGFDLDGITYDANGLQRDWISDELQTAIAININCYKEQYDNFTFLNQRIDGKATLNENIADHVGVLLAFNAYKKWLDEYSDTLVVVDERNGASNLGLTELQAFFISLGYFHCAHPLFQVLGDNADHAPESVRLTGLLSNSDDFSQAFNCSANSRMNPTRKCKYF